MKLIIAGSRTLFPDTNLIDSLINHFSIEDIEQIVSGGAKGVDTCGEAWANEPILDMDGISYVDSTIPIKRIKPDYNKYPGHLAPKIRNKEMAEYADALLLIWNGQSGGSKNMKEEMERLGKPIYEVILK